MEKKLIKLFTAILKTDPTSYLWYRDGSLKNHFRMGTPEGPCIEYSQEKPGKRQIGKLHVRLDEHIELRWTVENHRDLYQVLNRLEQDAIRLIPDPDYHKCLRALSASTKMRSCLENRLNAFFGIGLWGSKG